MKVNGSSSSLRPNITELDIESHSHLSNLTASQEIENLKRMNHVLTKTVASLEEDNKTFREKELRDRETEINEWVGEMQKTTDRDFFREKKLLELEFEKKRERDEVVEWKNRYCELEARVSKLIDETVAEFERKEREVQEMIAEVEEENRELKARALRVSDERCTLGGKRYEEGNFHVKEKEKEHIEIDDDDDDEIPPRHSTKKRLAEGSHSSKECSVSPKPTEFKRNGWKGASFRGEHVQTPLGSVTKEQEFSKGTPIQIFNFHVKEKEKEHIGIDDDDDDDEIPPRHSTKKRLAEGSHSSKECFVSPKPTEFKRNGWKRASFGGEPVQTPLGSVTKEQEVSKGTPIQIFNFHVKEKEKEHIEIDDDDDDDDEIPPRHSTKKRLAEGSHSSKECFVSPKPTEFKRNGWKRASFGGEHVQTPLGSVTKEQEDAGRGIRGCRKSALDRRSMRSFDKQKYWVYTGRTPTTEQHIHAEKRAQIFQKSLRSHNPSFIRSMVPSHVSGRFWFCLPSKFCKENLPAHDLKMILEDERGSEYKVKYIGRRAAIDGGWKRFVLAHKLELDDVLVFELQKPTRFKNW
ncbi:uncharacterized protein LOC109845291 isoform X2 [Asparagus officinalis]|uniref:uncharacterized protein LOC109845291 isoform X2 n=1 Tax=Asparagus officinalis TaxID=4686 RepID=UPI00098E7AF8|nr:uncharacterized protein LOC109845291 isoform X2 [Asparagus officinalis]